MRLGSVSSPVHFIYTLPFGLYPPDWRVKAQAGLVPPQQVTLAVEKIAHIPGKDLNILQQLQKDGRKSFREIAERLDVAEGTIYNRVNKLKEEGVIKNFMVDVDYSKLGYDLTTVIGVKVKGGHLPEIEEKIAKEKCVTAVYDITGEYDAIVVAKFPSRNELNKLVKKINAVENVERTYTMVVLNVVKEQHGIVLD